MQSALSSVGGDLSQSYIGTIVTDREQSFVLRAVTRRLPLPPLNVRAALFSVLRSLIITITSIFYGANFRSCRSDVSLLGRKRKEGMTRERYREGSRLDSVESLLSMLRRAQFRRINTTRIFLNIARLDFSAIKASRAESCEKIVVLSAPIESFSRKKLKQRYTARGRRIGGERVHHAGSKRSRIRPIAFTFLMPAAASIQLPRALGPYDSNGFDDIFEMIFHPPPPPLSPPCCLPPVCDGLATPFFAG